MSDELTRMKDELIADFTLQKIRYERELAELRTFRDRIEAAHEEHLRTGDYLRLGMAAQDALRALRPGVTG